METLLKDIKEYVFSLLQEKLPYTVIYHNLNHTLRVVSKIEELISGESITGQNAYLLRIAAWFHDVGYIEGPANHEIRSAKVAENFLKGKINDEDLERVKELILATRMDAKPESHLEKVMKDADCSHLASNSVEEISELLLQELKLSGIASFSELEWKRENIKFFTHGHRFYTNYAIENWQPKKQKNLLKLHKSVEQLEEKKRKRKEKKKADKAKANTPEKGVETMFRVTLRNHIKLSDIADTKANILLSVNAIIISIALGTLIPRLDNPSNAHLIIPTLVLVVFSVISIIFAIQSTRPKVTEGKFTREDVKNRAVNLLFFGNFHKMPLGEFNWAIREMMQDKDYLYDSLTKDLYYLGVVLNKKYKLLRTTYTIFTIGIIVSVVVFGLAFHFREPFVIQ